MLEKEHPLIIGASQILQRPTDRQLRSLGASQLVATTCSVPALVDTSVAVNLFTIGESAVHR